MHWFCAIRISMHVPCTHIPVCMVYSILWSSQFRSNFLMRAPCTVAPLIIPVEICIWLSSLTFESVYVAYTQSHFYTHSMWRKCKLSTKMCDMYFIISNYIVATIHKLNRWRQKTVNMTKWESERVMAPLVQIREVNVFEPMSQNIPRAKTQREKSVCIALYVKAKAYKMFHSFFSLFSFNWMLV